MIFNPDASKQAQEIIHSRKIKKKNTHPPLVFNNAIKSQTNSQKHLGVTLDLKLTFEGNLLNVFKTFNRTIGLMQRLQSVKCITKNNLSFYLQSLSQIPSGLWGYLLRPIL